MDYYYVCGCGREWFHSKSDVQGQEVINCTECGEEKSVDELLSENTDEMPWF